MASIYNFFSKVYMIFGQATREEKEWPRLLG